MRPDPREPFFTESDACENCGTPCSSRVWLPGFDYYGCDECALEASILIYAEENCETLYNAIRRAKMQQACQEHRASCPACIRKHREGGREIKRLWYAA
jgi:hypothetical protein